MKIRLCFVIAALAAFAPANSEAGLVSYFDFNATNPLSLTLGNGTLSTSANSGFVTTFNGTTNNAYNGDTAGLALAIQNGTSGLNNGSNLTLLTSTVGVTNVVVTFAIQATATGFQTDQFQYTTDGMTFINFGGTFTPAASFTGAAGLQTFDLSTITALNNDANAGFRILFNGGSTTSSSGNNRIDNIQVNGTPSAIPEPASIALLALGLAGAAMAVRRKAPRSR